MSLMEISRWRRRLTLVGFFFAANAGCSSLPDSAVAVLESADQFQIYRLEPNGDEAKASENIFQGHIILGQAEVKDANARSNIASIVNRGVRKGGTQAKCFNPRHGIHAVHAGKTVDLLICYECSAVEVHENEKSTTLTTGDVQSDLDQAFQSAGLPPLPNPR